MGFLKEGMGEVSNIFSKGDDKQPDVNPDGTPIVEDEIDVDGNRSDIEPDGSKIQDEVIVDGNRPDVNPDGSIVEEEKDLDGNVKEEDQEIAA